jgi:hypothetical protein
MRYIVYKTINLINGKYYIGRHATSDINDGYLGSGKGITNAIKKYGKCNFSREIIAEASSSEELWDLEKSLITKEMIEDSMCYNMTFGGKNHLNEMKKQDPKKYKEHQSRAGKSGGVSFIKSLSYEHELKWHSAGGKASSKKRAKDKSHPFYNGVASSMGGKALAGYIELWNPKSVATNKNQKCYQKGDCKRVKKDSALYVELVNGGWFSTEEHKKRLSQGLVVSERINRI